MIIKKYVAKNFDEIEEQIDQELGNQAVILSSRQVKHKGIKRWFVSDRVEVVATAQEKKKQFGQKQAVITSSHHREVEEIFQLAIVKEVLHDMPRAMQSLIQTLKVKQAPRALPEGSDPWIEEKIVDLAHKGVSPLHASELSHLTKERSLHALTNQIALKIRTTGPLFLNHKIPVHVLFCGYSGVGKTTAVIKMAQYYRDQFNYAVVILYDGFLKQGYEAYMNSLCNPLGIQWMNAESNQELREKLEAIPSDILVLIDSDRREIEEDSKYDESLFTHTFLVISASGSEETGARLIHSTERMPNRSLIFTKLDETTTPGMLLNLTMDSELPISYLSFDPHPTNELQLALPEEIAELITESLPVNNKKI